MKEWFTPMELVGLPGMPSTVQGVRYRGKTENYTARKCADGKGKEYHIHALPSETRIFLAKQATAELNEQFSCHESAGHAVVQLLENSETLSHDKLESGRRLLNLAPKQRKRVDARLLILQVADVFLAAYRSCGQGEVGRALFIEAYRDQSLTLPAWVYQEQRPFSAITLRRWQDMLNGQGPAALAGNYQPKKETALDRNRDLASFLTALITSKPHLANKWSALHELASQYNEMNRLQWEIPSQSSLRRWLGKWLSDNKVAFTYATDPDGYNNKYRTAIETMYPWMNMPNDVWEFDSTPVDAMLVDGRHSIIAVIDVYTRRVRLLVAKTSSSEGICLLLRKTLLSWGTLNENGVMRTDNGSDYVSQRVMSICSLLNINVSRSNAYSGWEKPHIERFFRTLSHGLIELLPSYIGHCVADRSVIEARKSFAGRLAEKRKPEEKREAYQLAMTAAELQSLLDNWLEARYQNRKHSTLGMTPNEMYQQARYQRSVIVDDSALDLLLNHIGEATVSKGFIKSGGLKYTAPELMEHTWKGQRVSVFLDPSDVGRAILYRSGEWQERVEAINVDLLGNGVSPDAFRAAKKADAKAVAKFRREMVALAKTWGIDELHKDVVNHFVEQARDIAQFQQGVDPTNNTALAALSGVITPNDSVHMYSENELAALEAQRDAKKAERELKAGQESKVLKNEFEQALLLSVKELDEPLSEREKQWLTKYLYGHKLMAKRINRQIDELKAARRSSANG